MCIKQYFFIFILAVAMTVTNRPEAFSLTQPPPSAGPIPPSTPILKSTLPAPADATMVPVLPSFMAALEPTLSPLPPGSQAGSKELYIYDFDGTLTNNSPMIHGFLHQYYEGFPAATSSVWPAFWNSMPDGGRNVPISDHMLLKLKAGKNIAIITNNKIHAFIKTFLKNLLEITQYKGNHAEAISRIFIVLRKENVAPAVMLNKNASIEYVRYYFSQRAPLKCIYFFDDNPITITVLTELPADRQIHGIEVQPVYEAEKVPSRSASHANTANMASLATITPNAISCITQQR